MEHPLGLLIFLAIVVFGTAIALWNFVPAFRDKMKGYSTVAEGIIMLVIGAFGKISGAIQDAQAAGYIPPQLLAYVPFVILAWFVVKRFATTTPVGTRPSDVIQVRK